MREFISDLRNGAVVSISEEDGQGTAWYPLRMRGRVREPVKSSPSGDSTDPRMAAGQDGNVQSSFRSRPPGQDGADSRSGEGAQTSGRRTGAEHPRDAGILSPGYVQVVLGKD